MPYNKSTAVNTGTGTACTYLPQIGDLLVAFAPVNCAGGFFHKKSLISAFLSSQKKKREKLPPWGVPKNVRVFLCGNRGCAQRVFFPLPRSSTGSHCWAEQFWSVTALGAPCWPSKAASAECAPARPRRASGRRASHHQRVCILCPAPPFTSPVRPRLPVPLRRGRAGPSGRRACHQRVYFPLPRRRQRPPLLAL